MEKLRCVVERITYHNEMNGYSVIRCRARGFSELVTVVGSMPEVHVGSVLSLTGKWKVDAKYGRQFAMETFEDYQNAIYRLEITRRLFSCNAIESETYRSDTVERDRLRTYNHNAVIAQVNLLNRMAEEASLPPFYGGVVSEEKPYRRELANAILDFIWEVIVNRA